MLVLELSCWLLVDPARKLYLADVGCRCWANEVIMDRRHFGHMGPKYQCFLGMPRKVHTSFNSNGL